MSSTSIAEPRVPATSAARVQALAFAHRNRLAALPIVAAFLLTRGPVEPARFVAAAALILLGAALRAWCTLYNRFAQGERKTLATDGPYAWSRNPLYLGNVLVLSGCALVAGPLWLLPLTWAWAFAVYEQVIRHEERRLLAKYGEAYEQYRGRVGRWLSRARPGDSGPRAAGLGWALAVQSRSLLILLLFAAKSLALGGWPGA